MSFHPRMFSLVKGFSPLNDVASLSLDEIVLDYWQVDSQLGARGRYVSMHPRLVFMLDDRKLLLRRHKTDDPCAAAAFYIPAGFEIRSGVDQVGVLRHLDVHLSAKCLRSILGPKAALHTPIFLGDLEDVQPFVEVLTKECVWPERARHHVKTLTHALVLELFRNLPTNVYKADGDTKIDPVRLENAVLEHAARGISVDDLARHFALSRSQFDRVFRSQLGQSPKQWITGFKIERSKSLLRQGHRIVEVADQFGFADQAHFSRVFKSITGKSPGVWINGSKTSLHEPKLQDNH